MSPAGHLKLTGRLRCSFSAFEGVKLDCVVTEAVLRPPLKGYFFRQNSGHELSQLVGYLFGGQ